VTSTRSNIFEAVRAAKPDIFNTYPSAITDLDELLDRYGVPRNDLAQSISQAGLDLIKHFEGLRLKAYQDSVGVWTIGVGHTKDVRRGDIITEAQADAFLKEDVSDAEAAVRKYCPVTTQGQFDALVSFTFNLGAGSLKDSTLRRKHNEGDYDGAANEFKRWVNAGRVKLNGLVRRRAAEAELYRS
jgi:lysozyme